MRIPPLPVSRGEAWTEASGLLSGLMTPKLRLGVTGLSRSGKTVFITLLVRSLVTGGRLPFLVADAEGRIEGATLEPQPDDAVPRFDYEAHLCALGADPPRWPESTRRISELRLSLVFRSESRLRRLLGHSRLDIDIVDYPGEWLVDLGMLNKDFAAWSGEALMLARQKQRADAAAPFLAFLETLDPAAPEDEQKALKGAQLFTDYLRAARRREIVATLGPGRFLMPGDLEGSPLLTFCPLSAVAGDGLRRGSLAAMMARRYESYRTHVVRPFFKDHFSRIDRQIVLVDLLAALNEGPAVVADLERALAAVLAVFRPGRNAWHAPITGKRVDRLLFAATKADHLPRSSYDRLEAILRLLTDRAIERAEAAGAGVGVMAIAALRATREAEARIGNELMACIAGIPLRGERIGDKVFDGSEEAAVFPGDLPADPRRALDMSEPGEKGATAFIRFRPPRVPPPGADGESAPAPHIRLDRALEFLFGDWLL